MESETATMSTLEKIQATKQLLIDNEATIMGNAAVTQELWEAMMHKGMLGDLYPTAILAKVLLAKLRQTENEILYKTIIYYFSTGSQPKQTKELNDKEWFKFLRAASSTSATQSEEDRTLHTVTPMTERMKLEIKPESYDGAKNSCESWFFNLESTLRKIKVHKQDYLLYASSNTTGWRKKRLLCWKTNLQVIMIMLKVV
jgi:hypothetical protein